MTQFISNNWFNLLSLAVMLITMGTTYGNLKARVQFNEDMIKDIKHVIEVIQNDIKSLLAGSK